MNRREFISNTCLTCVSGGVLSGLLTSCGSSHYVAGTLEPKGISVSRSEFLFNKKGNQAVRQYIVVHHDQLEFPIYLYQVNQNVYNALWMKCAHQGSELNAAGDHLYCSSHGSEYDFNGKVIHGPAERNLRTFSVSIQNDKIIIELTKG